jgi:hypothetical protein
MLKRILQTPRWCELTPNDQVERRAAPILAK